MLPYRGGTGDSLDWAKFPVPQKSYRKRVFVPMDELKILYNYCLIGIEIAYINMGKRKILIVDDEEVFAESLSTFLQRESEDLSVITAYNGEEALEIIARERVDLIVSNLEMPIMDGFSLMRNLRSRDIWVPIIILSSITAAVTNRKVEMFLKFGIVDYIEKPVDFRKLGKRVTEVLSHINEKNKPARGIDPPKMFNVNDRTALSALQQGRLRGFSPTLSRSLG